MLIVILSLSVVWKKLVKLKKILSQDVMLIVVHLNLLPQLSFPLLQFYSLFIELFFIK